MGVVLSTWEVMSEASSDIRGLGGGNGCGFSDVRGGMGSDVRGQGGAMGVSLVDSSDVRGQ